jgi:pimeloyl-ACP methyl ester carboxylesterase
MIPALLLAATAQATSGFDPSGAAARFTGAEVYLQDGSIQLWSAIERHEDPDRSLFGAAEYNRMTAWPASSDWSPWIADCFGTGEPDTGAFLLHFGLGEESSSGTPILFVPGAGDNGSRGFVTMAARMDAAGRPVYALTFAHPHGDVFEQAEVVADAIARVRARTGAAQVDVVSHSKGGIATAVYLSHHAGARWTDAAYEAVGTPYRGDVRRAVFIAVPLGGTDTMFRWPLSNAMLLDADLAMAPASWRTWSPGVVGWETDLRAQDHLPGDGDLFPGQRQLVARWDAVFPLPGESPILGAYALQPDWLTTYEGGLGFQSMSDGIDAVVAAGGDVLGSLERNGVDAGVELFVLAGENPLMHNGSEYWVDALYGEAFTDLLTAPTDTWGALMGALVGDGLVSVGVAQGEVQGLAQGKLMLGEVSGPSDGLVFVESATRSETLTGRGAVVVESRVVDLSHLDLLYASPVTGQLLIDAAAVDRLSTSWGALVHVDTAAACP